MMTKDRKNCGIKIQKSVDKIEQLDKEGKKKKYTFVSERIIKDDLGFIIGVEKIWQ